MKVVFFMLFTLAVFSVEAGVCIQINTENDTLMPNEQSAAKFICEKEFQNEGAVIDGSCTETYILTHLLLGNSIVIVLEKGDHKESVVVKGKDELQSAYNQLARYYLKGASTGYKNTTTENVLSTQAEKPKRLSSELNFMIMLGYGIQPVKDVGGGLNWTLGLRYDMRFMFLDFEFASGLWNAHGTEYMELNAVGFRGAYYFSEKNPGSFYIGAGMRAGFYFFDGADLFDSKFSGSGTVSIGYEWLRNTSKRFMVQIDAKFPFHNHKLRDYIGDGDYETKTYYFPTISFNVGVGL